MHAPFLKANPTNLELLQGFIENGKSLSNARGVTFQLNADMEATDEFIKTVDKDQTRRFTILSDHVIDAGRYYTLRKFSKESEWNSKFEYSWDGKRSHETNYHDGKDGIYSVSDKDTDQILALMVLEGLQFPYRIFYPESAQTELLYPTPNNLSSKISLDAVKSVVEGWKVEVDPEGGFSLSCKVSEGHSYTLSFTDNTFFPENYAEKMIKQAEESLNAYIAKQFSGVKHKSVVAYGTIYSEIVEYSNKSDIDLILMTSHRPELKDYLLGPNAARVARHAQTSIMIVRD